LLNHYCFQPLAETFLSQHLWHPACISHGLKEETTGENHMRKFLACSSTILLLLPIFTEAAGASDQKKDDDRLRNCGSVLKEVLNVPDNIPQDLLDKADCVVVFPSGVKAAFIVGGSYGRVGRDTSADTDASLRAEILSYSRARGLFAGVSLEGSTIRPDNGDNRRIYGKDIPARTLVLSGTVAVPPAAELMISTLDAKTPKHRQ
jgi:lipid-binding SYLF domain-containing protein